MEPFETERYLVRLLDKSNKEELRLVQKLRFDYLLKEFDPSLPEEGLDDDGFDEYCDSILVIDKTNGMIAGTYRVATLKTMNGHEFKCEEEFDIEPIKNDPDGMVETGRAVVHGDYRNGAVISLLWEGLFAYATQNHCRFVIGTASLHGTDYTVHRKCLSYLKAHYLDTRFNIRSKKNSYEYFDDTDATMNDIPSLLKTYLLMGARVSANGYIDYDFNSCDVLIITDITTVNKRFLQFIVKQI